jgi:hypothetical protein
MPTSCTAGERGHSQLIKTATDDIISFFDHNKDGSIGFDEFVLIVIALSVPEKDTEVVFDVMDLDNNGVLDEDEFMQVCCQNAAQACLLHTSSLTLQRILWVRVQAQYCV